MAACHPNIDGTYTNDGNVFTYPKGANLRAYYKMFVMSELEDVSVYRSMMTKEYWWIIEASFATGVSVKDCATQIARKIK